MTRRALAAFAAAAALASLGLAATASAGVTAARPSAGVPSYTNYTTTTKAGPPPSELGYDAAEPSIGVNWKTGKVMYQAGLQTLQAAFDDRSVPATMDVKDVTNPVQGVVTLDPILFTDSVTGRTFVSQLAPPCSIAAYTDTDGEPTTASVPGSGYTTSTGCGVGANLDHQTFSAGPAPGGLVSPYGPNRLVYYCSQVLVEATCARSFDGGVTFPQSAVMYTLDGFGPAGCSGLHGHLRIAPDGTAYMPNFRCTTNDGQPRAALVVADPGPVLQFEIRSLPTSTTTADFDSDPAVGIDSTGAAYMAWEDADNELMVAVTRDRGKTYTDIQDLGAPFGIKNATMPKVVAGSAGRAAVVFLGTPTEAPKDATGRPENNLASFDPDQGDPKQGWHLYVATTYDGGDSWVTVDVTPTDPVQRGCIYWDVVPAERLPSGAKSCRSSTDRNLLDFIDITIDRTGRVLVAYADGCVAACATDAGSTRKDDNATIARQTCGKGLLAEFDSRPEGPLRTCAAAASRGVRVPGTPSGRVSDGGRTVVPARN